jgi:hypothetical protein
MAFDMHQCAAVSSDETAAIALIPDADRNGDRGQPALAPPRRIGKKDGK